MALDTGSQISLAPGMSFGPGTTQGGVAIPVILGMRRRERVLL